MPDKTLYLFDGYNLLHAGDFADPRELRDLLASFVATQGAEGVLVYDGVGRDETIGPLEVRYAEHADQLLEKLAAENRAARHVCVVSTDSAVRGTAGLQVQTVTSQTFLHDLDPVQLAAERPGQLRDRLDPETLARLERMRRGQ